MGRNVRKNLRWADNCFYCDLRTEAMQLPIQLKFLFGICCVCRIFELKSTRKNICTILMIDMMNMHEIVASLPYNIDTSIFISREYGDQFNNRTVPEQTILLITTT